MTALKGHRLLRHGQGPCSHRRLHGPGGHPRFLGIRVARMRRSRRRRRSRGALGAIGRTAARGQQPAIGERWAIQRRAGWLGSGGTSTARSHRDRATWTVFWSSMFGRGDGRRGGDGVCGALPSSRPWDSSHSWASARPIPWTCSMRPKPGLSLDSVPPPPTPAVKSCQCPRSRPST